METYKGKYTTYTIERKGFGFFKGFWFVSQNGQLIAKCTTRAAAREFVRFQLGS